MRRFWRRPASSCSELRDRDDWNLTHYMYYWTRQSGVVRIPLDQAMELFAAGSRGGKDCFIRRRNTPEEGRAALAARGSGCAARCGANASGGFAE